MLNLFAIETLDREEFINAVRCNLSCLEAKMSHFTKLCITKLTDSLLLPLRQNMLMQKENGIESKRML